MANRSRLAAVVLVTACALPARAADHHPTPTIPWIVAQGIPSPGVAGDREGRTLSLRWQVTPLLWSWGIHRRASRRFRLFVVEHSMRGSGSFEVWIGPEWLRDEPRWLARGGLRSHFPVAQRGEALSMSIGTGAWTDGRSSGPVLEFGAYVLFGLFGVQVSHAPGLARAEWTVTFSVRVL
ncbi:MAG: hypothetical protein HYV09_21555 [Deltaproteobacteria bacterium]|nr:hypothetical protein [Deltaproteobacteria bacterium]